MCIHYKVRLEPGVWNSDTICIYMTQASKMTEHMTPVWYHMILVWHHITLVWHHMTLVWYDSGCIYTHPGWPQESGRIWTGCTCTHARAHSNWNQSLSPWLNSDLLIEAEYSPAGRQNTSGLVYNYMYLQCTYVHLLLQGSPPHLFRAASAASLYSLVLSNWVSGSELTLVLPTKPPS